MVNIKSMTFDKHCPLSLIKVTSITDVKQGLPPRLLPESCALFAPNTVQQVQHSIKDAVLEIGLWKDVDTTLSDYQLLGQQASHFAHFIPCDHSLASKCPESKLG